MFATNELLQSESNVTAGEFEWNTAGNPDGPATILTRVDDIDGHNGPYNFLDVTIDNSPPMIFLETPSNNSIVYGNRRPVISAQYSDLGSGMDLTAVKMYLDGSAVAPTTSELEVTFTPAYVKNNFGG